MNTIGATIKELRKEKKLTIRELARRTGVSHSYLSQIETGRNHPSPAILIKLAKGLERHYWLLLAEAGYEDPEESSRLRLEVRYMDCTCGEIFLIEYYEEKSIDHLKCPHCGKQEVEELGVITITEE